MACEIATFAIVNVNVGDLAATVNDLTAVTHKRWQPPRWASDALLLLDAQYGTLRCGRVERRAASEALGRVVKLGVNLLKRVMRQQAQKDWDSRLDHSVKVKIQGETSTKAFGKATTDSLSAHVLSFGASNEPRWS